MLRRGARAHKRALRVLSTITSSQSPQWTVNIIPGSVSILASGGPSPDEYRITLASGSADDQAEVLFGRSPVNELLNIVQDGIDVPITTDNYFIVQHPDGGMARIPPSATPSQAQLHAEHEAGFQHEANNAAGGGWDEPPHVMAHLVGCRVALMTPAGAFPMNGGEPLQASGAAATHILSSAYAYVAGGAAAVAALAWAMF